MVVVIVVYEFGGHTHNNAQGLFLALSLGIISVNAQDNIRGFRDQTQVNCLKEKFPTWYIISSAPQELQVWLPELHDSLNIDWSDPQALGWLEIIPEHHQVAPKTKQKSRGVKVGKKGAGEIAWR